MQKDIDFIIFGQPSASEIRGADDCEAFAIATIEYIQFWVKNAILQSVKTNAPIRSYDTGR